ncbi:response regulator transcription factor [bacterium]|nr:response regulator transcription factor [bacterium]
MPEKFTVILFSNQKSTVDTVSKALAGSAFTIAGITASFINTRTLLSQYAPEFLIVNLAGESDETNALLPRFKTVSPRTRILVIQARCNSNVVFDVIRVGADVFIPEGQSLEKLPKILNTLLADEIYLPPFVAQSLLARSLQEDDSPSHFPFTLTMKEQALLQAFSEGLSMSEAAATLDLSVELVKAHANNILQKIHFVDIARKRYEEIMAGLSGYHTSFENS